MTGGPSKAAGRLLPDISAVPRGIALRVLQSVRATIARHRLLRGGERVVVAVSGGPDSTALLDLLRRLAPSLSLRVSVAHVDHGLHRLSAAHAQFVRRIAAQWRLPVSVARVDAARYARRHRLSLEEAARVVRYAALARIAKRRRASYIALAHTADDQAETVLLWMLRGASGDGLAGMPIARPHEGLTIVRPLLDVWRADVLTYLRGTRIPFRVDPTNRSRRPLRNRIRHDLLPSLAAYNAGVKGVLHRLAGQAADDADLLARLADNASRTVVRADGDRVVINARALQRLPASLQRRVVYRAATLVGGRRHLTFVHVERVREMAAGVRSGARADLPGLVAARVGESVVLARARGRAPSARGRAPAGLAQAPRRA